MPTKKTRVSALAAAIAAYEAEEQEAKEAKQLAASAALEAATTPEPAETDVDMDAELEVTLATALLSPEEAKAIEDKYPAIAKRQRRKARRAAKGDSLGKATQSLADRLLRPIVSALQKAADQLADIPREEFTLVPVNPLRVVAVLDVSATSLALLDILARFAHRHDQFVLSRLRAVLITDNLTEVDTALREDIIARAETHKVPLENLTLYINPKSQQKMALQRATFSRTLERNVLKHGDDVMVSPFSEDARLERFLNAWLAGLGPDGIAPYLPTPKALRQAALANGTAATPEAIKEATSVAPTNPAEKATKPVDAPALPGVEAISAAHPVASHHLPRFLTPWATVSERDITRYAKLAKLLTVAPDKDTSILRHKVMPIFESMRPGFRTAATRSIRLTEEALEVLHDVAHDDLNACLGMEGAMGLKISALMKLVPARQAWCLRAWFERLGETVPDREKIEVILSQLREIQNDTPLAVRCRDKEVRRWGDWLLLTTPTPRTNNAITRREIAVSGEETISLPEWHGELQIRWAKPGEPGIALEKFLSGEVEVRARQGGEKIKLFALKPSKNLRDLYEEMAVPEADRTRLPLVWLDGELIYAAGLGLEIRAIDDEVLYPERLTISFKPDGGLWEALDD